MLMIGIGNMTSATASQPFFEDTAHHLYTVTTHLACWSQHVQLIAAQLTLIFNMVSKQCCIVDRNKKIRTC